MSNIRFFVEKKEGFNLEAKRLLKQFQTELSISNLKDLRLINCYDIFNINPLEENIEKIKRMVLSEIVTDKISENIDIDSDKYFAVELLPGQFDQRADSALQCINIVLSEKQDIDVKCSKLFLLYGNISDEDFLKIKSFYINAIEMREKNLEILENSHTVNNDEVTIHENFTSMNDEELNNFRNTLGLSISFDDLKYIQEYYISEKRNPTDTEIKVFDTYWSDHCRHTTFETNISNIEFPESDFGKILKEDYDSYLKIKEEINSKKNISLMDIATIMAKYLRKIGKLNDLEISEENNACSVYIDVDTEDFNHNKKTEKWLLMFKNETHNHPTEIEPFGGASTCLGGAIRDPLSGRAYVYQAIRVSGSANPLEKIENTLKGKLPQKKITTTAASGYSSYGNQIGIATSLVSEIYHPGYVAKRMEVGAVVAAAPLENVIRKTPDVNDNIIIIGGKTGRDGCGGATGSSKEHTDESLFLCGAEVQKGNAPEERKIQRLFRNKEATSIIKKCNDFGAGGVAVAIGELADGISVNLDLVPVKYEGLNGTELAISESQERMAVVVSEENTEKFLKLAEGENLLATVVGKITDDNRLILKWKNKNIVDISRKFLDTNGIKQNINIKILDINKNFNPFVRNIKGNSLEEKWINNIEDLNVASQKGLGEMFDSSIGSGSVLMAFGGKYQTTPIEVSVSKIPLINKTTDTASAITWGFNPFISEWSPYHGAIYSVIDSITKMVACGVNYKNIKLSFQEYFEKLGKDSVKWSKPFMALIGALKTQKEFNLAAIGGKDSMSGTFKDLVVPPTLISFAVSKTLASTVISPEFKKISSKLYLIKSEFDENLCPNFEVLKENYEYISEKILDKTFISAMSIKFGGLAETLSKMSFGNKIGFKINEKDLDYFSLNYGSILVESTEEINFKNAILIGETIADYKGIIENEIISLENVENKWLNKLANIFPYKLEEEKKYFPEKQFDDKKYKSKFTFAKPRVLIATFPGTNCEYDVLNAFNKNGGDSNILLFKNINKNFISDSIEEICKQLKNSQIFVLPGGFSAGDEPDGSGKFIAAVLQNPKIMNEINNFLNRDGLILGICNGFQALVKSGLLPYGEIGKITENSPTLTFNKIGRHISQFVKTKINSTNSPWLSSFKVGDAFDIPVSHGEGRFYASDEVLEKLLQNGQIATQYVDFNLKATNEFKFNPNGSSYAVEGIISPDGKIFGKMGHSERYSKNIYKNIYGNTEQNIFINGIDYFK